MPARKSIEFAESALVDLEAIHAWYVDQGVAEVGMRLIGEIIDKVEQLATFPESGRIVTEIGTTTVRELIHPPFRIVYRLGETRIWIVRVWRSERLLKMPG